MVNYDTQVYYSKVQYEEKQRQTKERFIKDKYDGKSKEEFQQEVDVLWKNIDHNYMQRTIEDLTQKVMDQDHVTMREQQSLPNKYELNPVSKFTYEEKKYADYLGRTYGQSNENSTDYLTQVIKDFEMIERTIPYYPGGNKDEKPISMHTPSEYLSMLYNVNLRMASWNQTIKDGEVLGIDLVILESHPNGCEICNSHMGKIYSISGTSSRYPSIDQAYNDGIGHPNCKCNFSLYWNDRQLLMQPITDDYEAVQKARGLTRDINRLETDYDLFRYIENFSEADKTIEKRDVLLEKLNELIISNSSIEPYLDEFLDLYDITSY